MYISSDTSGEGRAGYDSASKHLLSTNTLIIYGSPSNIINYDETNVSDDPGKKKIIAKRRMKYPKRVMNSSKSTTSIIFAASVAGCLLPPYVVYKLKQLYDTWTENGPATNTCYNRTDSCWFDSTCFMFTSSVMFCLSSETYNILNLFSFDSFF